MVPVTLTENVHVVLGASVAPERLTAVAPAAAVIVPPPHEPTTLDVGDTTSPAGSESVKCNPVSVSDEFGFWTVKVIVVAEPSGIDAAANDCWIVAEPTNTCADAELPVPPLVEETTRPAGCPHRARTISDASADCLMRSAGHLGESLVQALAKLIRGILTLGTALAGDDHAGRGHAGQTGEPDELPAHAHSRVG